MQVAGAHANYPAVIVATIWSNGYEPGC